MKSVFIVGQEGTTGLRLKERLAVREDIELLQIEDGLRKDTGEILRIMQRAEFTFLCLPDDAAREIAAFGKDTGTRIIDTSTAHRTAEGWAYGFPEISPKYRENIKNATQVASPGCHSSGFIALIAPLVAAGVISPDFHLSCTSLTGYSGGGKKMIAQYESDSKGKGLYLYSMAQSHKHLPEMIKHSGLSQTPAFTPVVGMDYAGMVVTVSLNAAYLNKNVNCDGLRALFKSHYSGSPIIRVSEEAPAALYASEMAGRDDMEIFVTGSDENILLTAAFDNLGKGASGAALQCLSIMCGMAENTGLVLGLHNCLEQ